MRGGRLHKDSQFVFIERAVKFPQPLVGVVRDVCLLQVDPHFEELLADAQLLWPPARARGSLAYGRTDHASCGSRAG